MSGSSASRTFVPQAGEAVLFSSRAADSAPPGLFCSRIRSTAFTDDHSLGAAAEGTLDLMKQTWAVRYRELYGTSNADPGWMCILT